LNPPYEFSNAKAILTASEKAAPKQGGPYPEEGEGKDRVWQAVEEARTQHRQKTAAEIRGLAETVEREGWDDGSGEMKGLLEIVGKGEGMEGELRKVIKWNVKGVGDTGLDVFLRRVQAVKG
jgi:hypothetical protein